MPKRKSNAPTRALASGEAGPSAAAAAASGGRPSRSDRARARVNVAPPSAKGKVAKKTAAASKQLKGKKTTTTKKAASRRSADEDNEDEQEAPARRGPGRPPKAAAARANNPPAAAAEDDEEFHDAEADAEATEEDDNGRAAAPRGPAPLLQHPPAHRRIGRPPNPAGRFIGGPNSPSRRAAALAAAQQGQTIPPARSPPARTTTTTGPPGAASPTRRFAEQGIRAADVDQLEAARLRGNTVRLLLTVELSDDLLAAGAQFPDNSAAGPSSSSRAANPTTQAPSTITRMIEVPALCEVRALRRYIHYYCGGCLPPAMQRLRDGLSAAPLHDLNARGEPNTLGNYGLADGARVTLTVVPPETEEQQLAVGAALAGDDLPAPTAGLSPRRPGDPLIASPSARRQGAGGAGGQGQGRNGAGRWSLEEMEALVGGIEAWGLSWADVRNDARLAARDNVNCKDKFRNMCLTVLQGRAERKVSMPYQIRQRVTRLAEVHNVRV
jgi:hypothetical protein